MSFFLAGIAKSPFGSAGDGSSQGCYQKGREKYDNKRQEAETQGQWQR